VASAWQIPLATENCSKPNAATGSAIELGAVSIAIFASLFCAIAFVCSVFRIIKPLPPTASLETTTPTARRSGSTGLNVFQDDCPFAAYRPRASSNLHAQDDKSAEIARRREQAMASTVSTRRLEQLSHLLSSIWARPRNLTLVTAQLSEPSYSLPMSLDVMPHNRFFALLAGVRYSLKSALPLILCASPAIFASKGAWILR
jgi:hypothetical protein